MKTPAHVVEIVKKYDDRVVGAHPRSLAEAKEAVVYMRIEDYQTLRNAALGDRSLQHWGIRLAVSRKWLVDADNRVFATSSLAVAYAQLTATWALGWDGEALEVAPF